MFLVALLHFCFRKKALKALSFWIFLSQKEPLEATFSETCALTSRNYVAEETKSNPKQNLINYCEAASSEACAHTPRKWFAEEDKTIRKWLERHKLLCLHSFVFAFRIWRSEIIIFTKESLVATFDEKRALTSRKFLTEQSMGVTKWSENHRCLWLQSYIFILEFYPQRL